LDIDLVSNFASSTLKDASLYAVRDILQGPDSEIRTRFDIGAGEFRNRRDTGNLLIPLVPFWFRSSPDAWYRQWSELRNHDTRL